MNLRESINTLLNLLHEQNKLMTIDMGIFAEAKNVLIFRSAALDIFTRCVETLKSINPGLYFYIITPSKDREYVKKICGKNCEIIEVNPNGKYKYEDFIDMFDLIKEKDIEKFLILYNNRYGAGYENIENIIVSMEPEIIYAFNSYSELFQINNPKLRLESLRLLNALANWFWEYIAQDKKD